MKFNSRKGDYGVVVDANGHQVPWPIAGDTHTGWVLCAKDTGISPELDQHGHYVTVVLRFQAPLQVLPIDGASLPVAKWLERDENRNMDPESDQW